MVNPGADVSLSRIEGIEMMTWKQKIREIQRESEQKKQEGFKFSVSYFGSDKRWFKEAPKGKDLKDAAGVVEL